MRRGLPRMVAASAIVAVASLSAVLAPADATVGAALADGFESGTLQAWSSYHNATADSAAAVDGAYGADLSAHGGSSYADWMPSPTGAYASVRAYVQVVSWTPGQSVPLITVQNGRILHNFDIYVNGSSHRFTWDLYSANNAHTSYSVQLGRWYTIEAQCSYDGNSYHAQVRIDGVDQASITSSGQKSSTVRAVYLGTTDSGTHRVFYDDVAAQVGDSTIGFLG